MIRQENGNNLWFSWKDHNNVSLSDGTIVWAPKEYKGSIVVSSHDKEMLWDLLIKSQNIQSSISLDKLKNDMSDVKISNAYLNKMKDIKTAKPRIIISLIGSYLTYIIIIIILIAAVIIVFCKCWHKRNSGDNIHDNILLMVANSVK